MLKEYVGNERLVGNRAMERRSNAGRRQVNGNGELETSDVVYKSKEVAEAERSKERGRSRRVI